MVQERKGLLCTKAKVPSPCRVAALCTPHLDAGSQELQTKPCGQVGLELDLAITTNTFWQTHRLIESDSTTVKQSVIGGGQSGQCSCTARHQPLNRYLLFCRRGPGASALGRLCHCSSRHEPRVHPASAFERFKTWKDDQVSKIGCSTRKVHC